MHKPKLIFLFIVFALSSIFLLHYYVVGQAVYGDGIYYYAITHSIYFDHDLNTQNQLGHHYSPKSNNSSKEEPLETRETLTKTGLASNKYPLGSSLAWLAAISLSDVSANLLKHFNPSFPNNGYSNIYQISVGLLNILFVSFGLFLLYKFLLKSHSQLSSLLAVSTLIFGSNLLYYGGIDVINSHPLSFLVATVFLIYWSKNKNKTYRNWLIIGIIIGILALVRTQDLIFLSLVIFENIFLMFRNESPFLVKLYKFLLNNLLVALGFLISFFPQLIEWRIIFGNFLQNPYISSKEGFNFFSPHLFEIFFSSKVGLFIWTPIYLFCFVGLFLLLKKNRYLSLSGIILLFSQIILISSWSGWSQGESFSIRMLISGLPFLALGLVSFIDFLPKKWHLKYLFSFTIVSYNLIAIFYFLLVAQSPTFDRGKMTQPQELNKIETLFKR